MPGLSREVLFLHLWLAVAVVMQYLMWISIILLHLLLLLLVLVLLYYFAITQPLKRLLKVCVELFSLLLLLLMMMIITKLRNHLMQLQWNPCGAMTRPLWGL